MKNLLYIITLLALFACNSKHQKKEVIKPVENFNLITKGKGRAKPKVGDLLTLRLQYANNKGETIVDKTAKPVRMPLSKSVFTNDVNHYLAKLHVGDSASFIVPANLMYSKVFGTDLPANVKAGSDLTFNVKLLRIEGMAKTGDALNIERDEKEQMNHFMQEQGVDFAFTKSGLRYYTIKKGSGPRPKKNDEVRINYTGKFLNGKIFDTSYTNHLDFEILIGRGDVIKGFEEGLTYMRLGGKTLFIIPSYLAFGKKGSGNLIPPNTPLLFEIELLKLVQN